jgi:iron(III) transport system ATP-binding protein
MIIAEGLNKLYKTPQRTVDAMKDVNLSIEAGSFFVLLGPSGSGKTTTLRSIAGLERPDSGQISINDEIVYSSRRSINLPPEQRPIAMVFQSYALWPHMDVANNITFPLRRGIRRVTSSEVERRLDRVLHLLNLTEQKLRPISSLSGGQQQRVALARALALEPAVLLMDEPLSNLDAKLRARLRLELRDLTKSIGITTIYVTHDQTEAMMMGDRIAVMSQGAIQQQGAVTELYQNPSNVFVARFLGEMNFIEGDIESVDADFVQIATAAGKISAKRPPGTLAGKSVMVGFRPEDIELLHSDGPNVIQVRVKSCHYLGDVYLYEGTCAELKIQFRSPKFHQLNVGEQVHLRVPAESCVVFDKNAADLVW